jgi:hypothetical protein
MLKSTGIPPAVARAGWERGKQLFWRTTSPELPLNERLGVGWDKAGTAEGNERGKSFHVDVSASAAG